MTRFENSSSASVAMAKSKLYVDRRESTLNEAGDFLFPKKEGAIDDAHILVVPTRQMAGIESPELLDDGTPNYAVLGGRAGPGPAIRQIQVALQGVYSMEQKSAGDVKIF